MTTIIGLPVKNIKVKQITAQVYSIYNRVLRRIFGSKMDEVTGEWREKYIMRRLTNRTAHQI
jgi:hypothetical protein